MKQGVTAEAGEPDHGTGSPQRLQPQSKTETRQNRLGFPPTEQGSVRVLTDGIVISWNTALFPKHSLRPVSNREENETNSVAEERARIRNVGGRREGVAIRRRGGRTGE